jgi:hypothetical protein
MKRHEPEFAVLYVTRDEAVMVTSETGGPITPADVSSMWLAKGESGRLLQRRVTAWIIANYETMRDGTWPDVRPEEIPSHGGFFRHAPYEMPGMYAAEVWKRINACGPDGELCWRYYQGEPTELSEANCKRINRALAYSSGWVRKRVSYKEWAGHWWHVDRSPCSQ